MCAYFQEPGDEIRGQTRAGVLLRSEVLHHMGELLPVVEGFL